MLLRVVAVEKSFEDQEKSVPVLRGVSLELDAGETLALTGESGSGKSTLLHIAAGLERADAGEVYLGNHALGKLDDAALSERRRCELAVVFQQFNLVPSLTVGANIRFHAQLAKRLDLPYVDHLVDRLGLSEQLHKYPETLSGGQQQRVAIARALAAKPKLLLADEPTGNLDEGTSDAVMDEMLSLVAETGAGFLVVTHSPKVAGQLMRRVHLKAGALQ